MLGTPKALDAEPPIQSFLKSMLIGGGPVNGAVRHKNSHFALFLYSIIV